MCPVRRRRLVQSPEIDNPRDTGAAADGGVAGAPRARSEPQWHHVPVNYDTKTGRFLAIAAGVLAMVLVIAFFLMHHRRSRQEASLREETAGAESAPPVVDVVTVKRAASMQSVSLPGETRAWYESTIYARVSGYIDKWFVDIGDRVSKGKVLATIDTPELDAQLRAAGAKLKAAEAQVAVEQANSNFAKTTFERWNESPKGVVSEQERESKKADYDSSLARLQAAQSQVHLSQADLDSLTALTRFKEVTAPYDGVISARHIDIGDLVTAGSTSSTTSLYNIAQSDTIRLFVDVPQTASSGMTVGTPVVATTSEFRDRKFEGKIVRTANSIDPVSRTLHVEADIPNPDLKLVPGMYVEASFKLARKPLLEVPASALLFRSNGPEAAVVGPDNKVSFHPVTIALDQGDFVEIGSGLSEGDRVALNISSQIDDGGVVSANDIDNPAGSQAAANVASGEPGR